MKHVLTALVTLCMAANGLNAQQIRTTDENRFGFGVFAGANYIFPIVRLPYPVHFDPHNNMLAGVDLHYKLNRRASLHLQPAWTKIQTVKPRNSWEIPVFSFHMLNVPIVYRYYLSPHRKLLFFQAGGSFNYLIGSDYREEQDIVCVKAPCPRPMGPNMPALSRSVVSGVAGIGVNVVVQKISIPVTLQYERYISGYLFPSQYEGKTTAVKFEGFSLTTGVAF